MLVYEGQHSVKCTQFHYPGSYISIQFDILCKQLCIVSLLQQDVLVYEGQSSVF